ncbi:hypothetical protein B0I00_2333 [Novosphingobium kunmingense]|uniref:Lipoprotein n=1 Tax=Novosphingobium kunmingense TaxID=1211806 RepID=A0A2N0H712_9SPHN|nr:hypothetical protein [Novosphingobium kunmingense]PKB14735.1 hypothetical protein B0I00_2333 [Novosphingobium kunmingense]
MNRAAAASLAVVLALSGCGKSEREAGGKAEGEVLPGSVSDAMLPYDQVKSQPPLAPATGTARTKGQDPSASSRDDSPAAAASEAAPSPSASASPTPAATAE